MKTIEERAEEYANEMRLNGFGTMSVDIAKYGYIKGATDQKAIDDEVYRKYIRYLANNLKKQIDKAIEALYILHNDLNVDIPDLEKIKEVMRNAMNNE